MGILIGWIVFTVFVGIMASNYGRSVIGWTLLSLVLSPLIAFIGLLIAGKSDKIQMEAIRKEEEMRIKIRSELKKESNKLSE